jgi:serine/threonine protein kinase
VSRFYFKQIVEGLKFIHEKGMAHRDIKIDNLLLTDHYQTLKIGDFGSVAIDLSSKEFVGTHRYMAPEVFQRETEYNCQKADVFSLGVTLYALIFNALPFDAKQTNF